MKTIRLMALLALLPATALAQDLSSLMPTTLVYQRLNQGSPIAEITRTVTRETKNGVDLIKLQVTTTGTTPPMTAKQEVVVEAKSFKPVSASMNQQAGGQEATAFATVADGRISGMMKTPQNPDPVMIDAEYPAGATLPGMDELAIRVADLAVGKELTFNALNPMDGTTTATVVKVVGESKQHVAAGDFDVYDLELKLPNGSVMKQYVRKAAPHILVKQQPPNAAVSLELKEIK